MQVAELSSTAASAAEGGRQAFLKIHYGVSVKAEVEMELSLLESFH